jgi:hypothetical protein
LGRIERVQSKGWLFREPVRATAKWLNQANSDAKLFVAK